ncbi:ABC transporter substrate-binding protein [Salinicoccus luteus]|uniref:ABC transporter substrate-binding protein n=1 Tax=Salinicoccus luteus TaxID=367840 RepID=UPI0004E2676A|nr:ABC transporter substrate-binding protein [Salinicoccus luteus]
MKTRLVLMVLLLGILSACSSFRETGVSEDGSVRQVMTEHTEEIEIPAEPERVVLLRAIDAGNASLLGGNVAGVTDVVRGTRLAEEALGEDVAYLEHGDIEALKTLDPDLIITFTPDEYLFEYQDIAPTVQINYSTSAFSPFRDRLYLAHLYNLGVILNRQEEAEALGDEWLEETTRLQREVGSLTMDKKALVLVEGPDSYYIYGRHSAFGTEAVYDVLGFQMDDPLEEELQEGPVEVSLGELEDYEADYVFVSTREPDSGMDREIARAMGIDEAHVIMQDYDDYRLNDLISIEMQTEDIIERIKP